MTKPAGIFWKSLVVFVAALLASSLPATAAPEKKARVDSEKESVSLNRAAFERAKLLIQQGKVVVDEDKSWSTSLPSAAQANQFIGKSGWGEYAKWHLGVAESLRETTKHRYKFPFGDFANVYRSALVAAKNRAAQTHHNDIRDAATELLDMIDHQPTPGPTPVPAPTPTPKKRSSPQRAAGGGGSPNCPGD